MLVGVLTKRKGKLALILLSLLLLRNPQNKTEYNYEKLDLTIMVKS